MADDEQHLLWLASFDGRMRRVRKGHRQEAPLPMPTWFRQLLASHGLAEERYVATPPVRLRALLSVSTGGQHFFFFVFLMRTAKLKLKLFSFRAFRRGQLEAWLPSAPN